MAGVGVASGQVSPAEILNPQLKAAEETYFRQLQTFNGAIQLIRFPFPFTLTRYANRDPQKKVETDTRGLEFVKFHERVVLKITGVYGAAYHADRLTQNERASRVFQDVIVPILQILPKEIPADVKCDAVGFEISYHVRRRNGNYDYEGKENLVTLFDKADSFDYFKSSRESVRQDILNRSEIYLNGKEFGLALGEREALNVEGLDRSAAHQPTPATEPVHEVTQSSSDARVSRIDQDLPPGFHLPEPKTTGEERPASPEIGFPAGSPKPEPQVSQTGTATQADADRLQAKYQPQLDGLVKDGAAQLHFVDYAPPSFVVFRGKIFMQLTLRNPLNLEKETTSIYKRAAQSFDLFLAPQLKPLIEKIPADSEIEGLDITLLNQLASKPKPSSEALEFICPLKLLRHFVEADITNQDLINQSAVLVNGVRIALDLQRVE
jgi:hypothetical protein